MKEKLAQIRGLFHVDDEEEEERGGGILGHGAWGT